MSDPLPLARRLTRLDDDALITLLLTRQPPPRELRDFFDLADALLDPASIRPALRTLPRTELERLASGAAPADLDTAVALALVVPDAEAGPSVPPEVAETAGLVLAEHPLPDAPGAQDAPPAPEGDDTAEVPEPVAATARERAFTAITAVAELVQQLRVAPARVRARGGVSVAEEKRLAPLLSLEPEAVGPLAEVAVAAGLAAVDGEELLSTESADAWSTLTPGGRWLALAGRWLDGLPAPLPEHLRTARVTAATALDAAYPAADEPMHTALLDAAERGELLGVWASGRLTLFGRTLFESATDTAPGALDAELPPEVDQVYLQHDLSVIAPGPLSPALDARLRLAADLENRGVASAYRISQPSIDRALSSGETEESLREFLGALSLTGIPQAVDYLLTEGARRHGLVRVVSRPASELHRSTAGDEPPRTLVQSADPSLLTALAADQALSALGLRRDGDGALATRATPASAYWLLLDARYPVIAEDADGRVRLMRRARVLPARPAASADTAPTAPAAVTDLVLRLRDAARRTPDDADAWTARLLDRAVRARTPVTIGVRMPDGSTTRLDVTPLSLANGRLRVSDERAGVERTVPVANIVELTAI
ncbi:helicase-associated domain-containing protein [Herbiconiux sp. VKM Ac-1786]|uniref:helicase-associated domain-containing protein n=1 Tax=Herbiconiux sp. VKM Ac-1786 TaxID=2783824 RepID=UPI00188DB4CA|nr:helicase-associated domain-containing protein [Herbiconiux sp. VKM Ac-1786]MBF4571272.1 helicase-associated domain-containing protein [Herbiconiux sp. VKM Ac-1786]